MTPAPPTPPPTPAPATRTRGRSEARDRLLATAGDLFYDEGIRSTGIERILAETPSTRATFYRHFPSKEDLVLAYLHGIDTRIRLDVHTAVETAPTAADALRAIASTIAEQLVGPGFRGCALLRAAAEFPHAEDPVHRAVADHRAWFRASVAELFTRAYGGAPGRPQAGRAARHFVMLRDGAMAAAHLDDADDIGGVLRRGVEGLLTVVHARPADDGPSPVLPR